MANYTYHDYTADMKRYEARYGQSYIDFNKMLKYYNLSRLPDYENAAEPYIAYILMSRPSLYVTDSRSRRSGIDAVAYNNLAAMQANAMTAAFVNDQYGHDMLMQLSEFSSSAWLPIITTKAMSYTVNDFELKTNDKGNTYYGHSIKYGKHSEEHKIANTISIDFRNDRYLSIMKMMYIWMAYIYQVSKNDSISPSDESQQNGLLDYCGSIYYLICRRDGRELVYWEKLVGVFPIRCPFSIFSSNDSLILEDKVSIDFQYSIKADPCDPSILMDINFLSGDTYNTIKTKTRYGWRHTGMRDATSKTAVSSVLKTEKTINGYETPFVKGDVFATNPYISVKRENGRIHYYLLWENRG